MIDPFVQFLSAPFVSGLIGLIGLLVSVIGLSIAVFEAQLAAKQAKRAADISEQSRAAVDQVLTRIDREGALLDATAAIDALARAMRDLGKKRVEDAVLEAGLATSAIQRLLADKALETEVFGAEGADQLEVCIRAVGEVRTQRMVRGKASSFPPDAMVRFWECLQQAQGVLQRAVPIITRSNRT